MEINVRRSRNVHILEVAGELDFYNSSRLHRSVENLIDTRASRLLIDLREVSFLDSSAVGTLVAVHAALRDKGLALQITGVDGSVKSALELTGVARALPIASSREEALAHLQSEDPHVGGP